VGPDYVRPQVRINTVWSEQHDPRVAANAAIDVAWWHSFGDPALDQLVTLAFHENLTLQVAGVRILEARAQLGVAIGEFYPSNPGRIGSASYVGQDNHHGEYQVGFDAVWELDFWGKYRRGIRAARATYLATIADYDNALVALSAEVARTYVTIRTFDVLIDLAKQNEQLQQEGLQIAESRFRNGATSELDVAQASNLLETTRATIPNLELGRQQARNALSTLLGQPTGYVQAMLANPTGIPAPPPKVAISVPAEMLRRRPDIRAAELRAIAQCDQIGVAKAELFPKFVLFGAISTQHASNTGGHLFGPGSLIYNAGGSLFWPILQYPTILNNVRVEDARFQELLLDYVNTVLVAAQEVEDGMVGYLRSEDSAVFAQNAVTAAETAVKLALVQYREGAVDYTRVLDTQRALLQSQNTLVTTQSQAVTSLIALYKALGGGWEVRDGEPVVPNAIQRAMQSRTNWNGYFSKGR
jgi:NodT family efflux transporter outer membrane factor (OMF) lipoprotein